MKMEYRKLKPYLLLWGTQSLSALGSAMTNYALVIWLYQKSGSALETALLSICSYAPYVLMSVFAGVLSDRWDKKRTMLCCDLCAAVCTLIVLGLLKADRLLPWHMYILNALSGLMNTVQQPASDVAATLLVPRELYQKTSGNVQLLALNTLGVLSILTTDDSIQTVEDLAGKTVSLGERESGVLQNALQVLDAYNLQESDFTPEYLSFSESAQAMKEGKIDAAFITAAIPTPAVTNLADSIGVRVLSIDPFSYYTPCTIPANTYAGQSEAAQTVGVRAVVVARNDMPEDQVKSIMQLLFNGQIPFAEKLKSLMQPTLEEATEGVPIAFHPGAAAYYADNDITVDVMNSSDEGKSVSGGQDD